MAILVRTSVDAAILEIRLGNGNFFPAAVAPMATGVRAVFVTGFDDRYLPGNLDDVPIHRKPSDPDELCGSFSDIK